MLVYSRGMAVYSRKMQLAATQLCPAHFFGFQANLNAPACN
jgi:hypothetical protein